MRFVIKVQGEPFPIPEMGTQGAELSGYIPSNTSWKQINYGQGEGQVEIGGCEWGFYQTDDVGTLAIQLHTGFIAAADALDFVQRVGEKTCGSRPLEILLQGADEG